MPSQATHPSRHSAPEPHAPCEILPSDQISQHPSAPKRSNPRKSKIGADPLAWASVGYACRGDPLTATECRDYNKMKRQHCLIFGTTRRSPSKYLTRGATTPRIWRDDLRVVRPHLHSATPLSGEVCAGKGTLRKPFRLPLQNQSFKTRTGSATRFALV
jgi:hypothetical protein